MKKYNFSKVAPCRVSLVSAALQRYRAYGSGAARISTWKSLSDVADHAAPMHVARQRVLATPRTLRAVKSVRFENKKSNGVRFGIC